jgi:hypothetical protein
MKKKILLGCIIASSLLLSGCGKSAENISFQDGYSTLFQKVSDINGKKPENLTSLQDTTTAAFTVSSQQGFSASGMFIASGVYDTISGSALIDLSLDASMFEPSFNASATITGWMKIIQNTESMYAFIDGLSLTTTSGDLDGGIVNALIGTISKKWINLTETGTGTMVNKQAFTTNLWAFSYHLIEGLRRNPLMIEKGKTMIDGSPAYILWRNTGWVSGFVHYLLNDAQNPGAQVLFSGDEIQTVIDGITASPLSGYLIVHSEKDIELRIMSITTKDTGILSASFRTTKPATRSLTENGTNTVMLTGTAFIDTKWLHFINTLTTQKVSIDVLAKPEQKWVEVTLITPDIRVYALIKNAFHAIDAVSLPTITGSTPLSQIMQWFSMLGGGWLPDDTGSVKEPELTPTTTGSISQ